MKCSFCDQQLSDLDKYCPNCGSEVDIPPEKYGGKEPNIVSETPPLVIKSNNNKFCPAFFSCDDVSSKAV